MPERPAVIQALVLERLEGRLALSSMTSYPLSRADIADVLRDTVEIGLVGSAFDNRESRTLTAGAFNASIPEQVRARSDLDLGPSPEREDPGPSVAIRRSGTSGDLSRVALYPIETSPHPKKLSNHFYGLGLDLMQVQSNSVEENSANMLPLVDDTPSWAASSENATGDPSGVVVGFDSQAGLWKPLALTASGFSGLGTAAFGGREIVETQAVAGRPLDGAARLDVATFVSGAQHAAANLSDLLEGVLQSDWDDIELEMRQFLSRLGTMVDGSHSHSVIPKWPVWIVTAAIAVVLRRFSQGGRLNGRPITRVRGLGRRHHTFPLGPWPLDSA